MESVIITLRSQAGNPVEQTELCCEGTLAERDGKWWLCYEEGAFDGNAGTKTTLLFSPPGRVIITRMGDIQSRLVITEGKTASCLYATPYGELQLDIYGEQVTADFTATGGRIFLKYRIDALGKPLSQTEVEITFRKV